MENGVEALKLAASILIFVLAITITISCFTSATQAINRIFAMREDEYVKDAEGNYLSFVSFDRNTGTREVGVETIIPSIYRAYKENYAIYFYNADGTEFLWENEKGKEVNFIDLEQEAHSSAEGAIESIKKILYTDDGLYERLQVEKGFIEKLGEYYMDDLAAGENIAEVNKTKKRVIVYQAID